MPINYGEGSGDTRYLRLPKVGQSYDFSTHGAITKAERVETGRFHFEKNVTIEKEGKSIKAKENLGYHIEYTFDDGKILPISSWSPYYSMKDKNIQEGDLIKISHPEKGRWVVEKLVV